ncbi:MAG: hypothetical protein J6O00_01665 [Clostridiales bacterium]|nr:hypothetical protein [Clostridiales bacterium]
MSATFYDLCFFFVIYSIAGWIIEVIFHAVVKGVIVNRGFLNGPVCPVYGFGMISVILIYNLIGSDNTFVVFLEGVVFTTLIELIAGFILDKCFHARWWDYSKMPLNLNGYICAGFSLIWGLAVVFVVKLVHVFIYNVTSGLIPEKFGWPILIAVYAVFILDATVTVLTLIGLNKKLEELDRISASIKRVSDRMTDNFGNTSLKVTQKAQESAVQASLAKAELRDARLESRESLELRLKELQDKYETLRETVIRHRHFGAGRILNAFPDAKHRDYDQILTEIKNRIKAVR